MADLSLDDYQYLQLTTKDVPNSGIDMHSAPLWTDTMWSTGADTPDSTPVHPEQLG